VARTVIGGKREGRVISRNKAVSQAETARNKGTGDTGNKGNKGNKGHNSDKDRTSLAKCHLFLFFCHFCPVPFLLAAQIGRSRDGGMRHWRFAHDVPFRRSRALITQNGGLEAIVEVMGTATPAGREGSSRGRLHTLRLRREQGACAAGRRRTSLVHLLQAGAPPRQEGRSAGTVQLVA